MAYAKYYPGGWVDGSSGGTPVVAAALNNLENGLVTADTNATAAVPKPAAPATNTVMVWSGAAWVAAKLVAANVDPAAAIPASALAGYPSDATKFLNGGGGWVAVTSLVGNQLDYAQITADTAAIAVTTEGTATAVITGNSITYDGTRNKVEAWVPSYVGSVAGQLTTFVLLRDAAVLGQAHAATGGTSPAGGTLAVKLEAFDTPSAAAHVYKLAVFVSSGNVVIKAGAGGSGNLLPAFLRVTKA